MPPTPTASSRPASPSSSPTSRRSTSGFGYHFVDRARPSRHGHDRARRGALVHLVELDAHLRAREARLLPGRRSAGERDSRPARAPRADRAARDRHGTPGAQYDWKLVPIRARARCRCRQADHGQVRADAPVHLHGRGARAQRARARHHSGSDLRAGDDRGRRTRRRFSPCSPAPCGCARRTRSRW
jgi:hypothetical protein